MIGTFFLGVVLTGAAFLLDRNIGPSILLEVGVTIGLSGVLAIVEGRMVDQVEAQLTPHCHVVEPPTPVRVVSPYGVAPVRMCGHEPTHYFTLDGKRDLERERTARED